MYKSTTEKTPGVKGTGLVKALGTGLLDYGGLPAWAKVVNFLAYCGGDAHAPTHRAWHGMTGLSHKTYYRVLGQLEAEGVIEICIDRRCPHRRWGDLGWRFTLRFIEWLDRPDSPWQCVTGDTQSVSSMTHLHLVETRGTLVQPSTCVSTEEKERAAYAAAPSGRGTEEAPLMPTEDDWSGQTAGADPDALPRPPKGKSPTTRLRYAFEEECRSLPDYWGVPITPSVKQMMGGLRWLLDHGYSEEVILASFRYLRNVLPRQSVGPHRTMWEVYYQNKVELLKLGAADKVGQRPGEKPESLLELARRKNRGVR